MAAIIVTLRDPTNGYVLAPGVGASLGLQAYCTGDWIFGVTTLYYRKNGGSWQTRTGSGGGTQSTSVSATVALVPGDYVEWYVTFYYFTGSDYTTAWTEPWSVYAGLDTEDPTITNVIPETGNVAPAGAGVRFRATIDDNYQLKNARLYIDGELEQTWYTPGQKTVDKKLALGAHTYRWTAEDDAGNTADTGTVNITVANGAPEVPDGTLTVAGATGAVSVANLGSVLVEWPAFLDGNPEDSVTYTLEERVTGGAWAEYASGLTAPECYWTPDLGLGTGELRVCANDGTVDSAYLTRTGITVLSSQSPTDPVLVDPGGSSWREGETHELSWAAASHPESLPITYRLQFSKAGTFADAVLIASGVTGASYDWALPTTLVDADTHTCKLRVRAEDQYAKVSDWSTSTALTVLENAVPTIAYVEPLDEAIVSGNTPLLYFDVDDDDDDDVYPEVQLSVRPDFVGAIVANSAVEQTGWEEAADPYTSWDSLPSGGATAGNRVRWQSTALRYDYYYLRARASDGILTSAWLPTIRVLVTPSGLLPLTCTIGNYPYHIKGLRVAEKTGGEPSPMDFAVSLEAYREHRIVRGSAVSIALSLGGLSRVWNGTVETVKGRGAVVDVHCLQDDAYLSRRLVAGDFEADDIGANLAAMIDTYGAPLDSAGMDTALGLEAAIVGDYRTLASHLQEWAEVVGFMFWADETGTVHSAMPDSLEPPEYVLSEEYA